MDKKSKESLIRYLNTQCLMSLATVDKDGNPWSANVYYVNDNDFNFYFMSSSDSRHCKNLSINPNVSFTIADSNQFPGGKRFGIQLTGKASHVYNPKGMIRTLRLWNTKYSTKPAPPYKKIKLDSPFYQISVSLIKVFDAEAKIKFVEYKLDHAK